MQAVVFAKLQEENFSELCRYQRTSYTSNFFTTNPPSSSSTPTNPPPLPQPRTDVPVKRSFASELQERKDKGLLYSCNEIFLLGHKCKSKLLLLVHQDDEVLDPISATETASYYHQ